jgi:hypothetical protein
MLLISKADRILANDSHRPERNPRNLPVRFLAIPPNSVA